MQSSIRSKWTKGGCFRDIDLTAIADLTVGGSRNPIHNRAVATNDSPAVIRMMGGLCAYIKGSQIFVSAALDCRHAFDSAKKKGVTFCLPPVEFNAKIQPLYGTTGRNPAPQHNEPCFTGSWLTALMAQATVIVRFS